MGNDGLKKRKEQAILLGNSGALSGIDNSYPSYAFQISKNLLILEILDPRVIIGVRLRLGLGRGGLGLS